MKQLTTDEAKLKLVENLLERKIISFKEALSLLEVEVKTEYVFSPYYYPSYPIYIPSWNEKPFDFTNPPCTFTTSDTTDKYSINN